MNYDEGAFFCLSVSTSNLPLVPLIKHRAFWLGIFEIFYFHRAYKMAFRPISSRTKQASFPKLYLVIINTELNIHLNFAKLTGRIQKGLFEAHPSPRLFPIPIQNIYFNGISPYPFSTNHLLNNGNFQFRFLY